MSGLSGKWSAWLMLCLTCAGVGAIVRGAAPPPRQDLRIGRWIADLDDDQFAVREAAQRALEKAGPAALPALIRAADSPSLEVHTRAFRLLRRLAGNAATAEETRHALTRLAASSDDRIASKARVVLRAHLDAIVVQIENGGGRVTRHDDRVVGVSLDAVPKLAPVLPLLRRLPDLEEIDASTKQMDDGAMAVIRGLPRLRKLNLYRSSIGDEGVKHLASFPQLRRVPMGETRVTDAGLKHIAELTHLEYVGVRGNHVTDDGLKHLKKLTDLTGLYLGETKVTDAGLKHLTGMTKMETIYLHNLDVTDAGLEHLRGMTNLRQLYVYKTRVTAAGVERLKKAVPRLTVVTQER